MSWSVTVNNIPDVDKLPLDTEEYFASQHASYPRDAAGALALAKALGLRSATLCGGRTPNPYGGDEIVDVSVRGTPIYKDFLSEMQEIVTSGPGAGSDVARHWAALAALRVSPCPHVFADLPDGMSRNTPDIPGLKQCVRCDVYLNGTMLFFD